MAFLLFGFSAKTLFGQAVAFWQFGPTLFSAILPKGIRNYGHYNAALAPHRLTASIVAGRTVCYS